jgi:methionyl-tRNA synthetase
MAERIHITTAITYSNGPPHVGHAYEYLVTDSFVRYQRRKLGAENVTFVTGTDEHGQKNRDAAVAAGLKPKEFSDRIAALFREAHKGLNISDHIFVRTTDPVHEALVQRMLQRTYDSGDIYFKDYEGLYCVGCERFYTEKELLPGNICPTHNTPVERIKEGNYFLKLEKFREQILSHVRREGFIRPERYRNEALQMLAEPLEDLCISRPKSRLDWGIELPFDSKYVTYVWYDAFWAYLSELPDNSIEALSEVLPVTEHFIGKDILKTHAVYWPAMLLAVGLPVYRHLNVHGFLNFGGARFSKSSGNIADPVSYERTYGPDVLRYFFLREVTYGLDGDFSDERIVERYNSDLANDLGNLTSRVLSMAARYFQGEVTAAAGAGGDPLDAPLCEAFATMAPRADALSDDLAFNRALEAIWQALDAANKYIVATAPFTIAKDPAKLPRVAQILANLIEGLRVVADSLSPFMPVTSGKILDLLNVDAALARAPFGQGIKSGHRVKPATPLFPRIEKPKA